MKRILLLVILFFTCLGSWSVPALRIPFTARMTDGKVIQVIKQGDEFYHYYTTTDGQLLHLTAKGFELASVEQKEAIKSASRRARDIRQHVNNRRKMGETPKIGKVRLLVLLAEYKDVKFTCSREYFENLINGTEGDPEEGTASVWQYFQDQSQGLFSPQFDVRGPYTLGQEMAYYGGNNENQTDVHATDMIVEACRLADKDVDFSDYDNNGDGVADMVFVVYAGYGEAYNSARLANTVWPHHYYVTSPLTLDGTTIYSYACSNELYGDSGTEPCGIGTFCHEFSHCIGLPDFYDTQGKNFGMGDWDIMDNATYNNKGRTPCGYTSYERDFMGWRSVEELRQTREVNMKALTEGGLGYKIVNDANIDEYYLLENRQQKGWDKYCPAHGLLILHVDYLASAWSTNRVNVYTNHPRMTIIPADNRRDTGTMKADTYPGTTGNTALTDETTPAAKVYMGGYMGKSVTDITETDGTVSFIYEKGALPVPEILPATDINGTGFTAHWRGAEGVDSFLVVVSEVTESPYILEETFDNFPESTSDISGIINSYTICNGWSGVNLFSQDGYITIGKEGNSGYLMSPYLEADPPFTIMMDIKKHAPSDDAPECVIAIGDDTWSGLWGYKYKPANDEWETIVMDIDTIGPLSWFYIDTRGGSLRVDVDNIYIKPGPYVEARRRGRSVQSKLFTLTATDTCLVIDGLPTGRYEYKVCSILGGKQSKYSLPGQVEITTDGLEPSPDVRYRIEDGALHLYADAADVSCEFYYTLDGTLPTAYSTRYIAPIPLHGPATVCAVAKAQGRCFSDTIEIRNHFTQSGVCYQWISTTDSTVAVTHHLGGNGRHDYRGDVVVADAVTYGDRPCPIVGIGRGAFAGAASLRSVVVNGQSVRAAGDSLFVGCTGLKAVAWDIPLPIPHHAFGTGYANLVVYLPEGMDAPAVPAIVVTGGRAETVELSGDAPFYNLRDFTAADVTLSRIFSQATLPGESAGWEAITLPFDVQQVTAPDGPLAPFGTAAVDGTRHFWLAEWSPDGFIQATTMRAGVPYVIAMPNNPAYGSYNVSGTVTFSAHQCTVMSTVAPAPVTGGGWAFHPAYEQLEPDAATYALNVGTPHDAYPAGSVFVAEKFPVHPFTAYAVPLKSDASPRHLVIGGKAGESPIPVRTGKIIVTNNILQLHPDPDTCISIYDTQGRCIAHWQTDASEGTKTIEVPNGVYFIIKNK